jgi:DNA repair photolyase
MKKWGNLKEVRLDEKEFKTDLGEDNFIFVGSGCDIFAEDISREWIIKILLYCRRSDNKYLFQTKNPERLIDQIIVGGLPKKSVLCTTIESNREYPEISGMCPSILNRAVSMNQASQVIKTYVTIEPIMDFDIDEMATLIHDCNPEQVNIGADSGGHKLPEPSKEKIMELISELETFTKVNQKKNLSRLLK